MIELRDRQVLDKAEGLAAVVRNADAAVVAQDQMQRIGRVDPQRVIVDMQGVAGGAAGDRRQPIKLLAAIDRARDECENIVNRVGVSGIDQNLGVVKRPVGDIEMGVDRFPGFAAVVGAQKGALFGLDQGVDRLRLAMCDGDHHAAQLALGQAVLFGFLGPTFAAVLGDVKTRARSAGFKIIGPAAELPHGRIELVRIHRIHLDVGGARRLIDIEKLFPGRAAVGGLVDAALLTVAPQGPQSRDIGDIRVGRMQGDTINAFGALKSHPGPGLAAVDGLVNAAADRGRVSGVSLAGADPDDIRAGLVDRHGADRSVVLIIEDRIPGQAAVRGLPDTTGGGPHIDRVGIRDYGVNGRDTAAGSGRADGPRLHASQEFGVDGGAGRVWNSECGNRQGAKNNCRPLNDFFAHWKPFAGTHAGAPSLR